MTTNLAAHARRELELSGQYDEDPAYSESIIAAVEAFASYDGHSGVSAMIARDQLHRLLGFENLSPLTSDPDEWIEQSEALWQNCRNSKAFSDDGGKTWWVLDAEGDRKEEPQLSKLSYWTRRVGLDRYTDALNPFSRLSWPIRLRLLLMVPWRSGWNARIRDWTARLEGHASSEDETTEVEERSVLGIRTEEGPMSLRDWVNEGAHVDAEGRTRRGPREAPTDG